MKILLAISGYSCGGLYKKAGTLQNIKLGNLTIIRYVSLSSFKNWVNCQIVR